MSFTNETFDFGYEDSPINQVGSSLPTVRQDKPFKKSSISLISSSVVDQDLFGQVGSGLFVLDSDPDLTDIKFVKFLQIFLQNVQFVLDFMRYWYVFLKSH
jgi:hypothetical protein